MAVGGLFAGESMFSRRRDASKVALGRARGLLRDEHADARLLDTQWQTPHLATLGVVEVPREEYLDRLRTARATLPLPAGVQLTGRPRAQTTSGSPSPSPTMGLPAADPLQHPAGEVDRLEPTLAQVRRGLGRAPTHLAHDQQLLVPGELVEPARDLGQGDVQRPVDAPVVPLDRLAHVEHGHPVGQGVGDLGHLHGGHFHHVREASAYLSSRDIRRSASGLPPVWQVGQYCRLRSAKLTSRIVSPQTGQGSPCGRAPAGWSSSRA